MTVAQPSFRQHSSILKITFSLNCLWVVVNWSSSRVDWCGFGISEPISKTERSKIFKVIFKIDIMMTSKVTCFDFQWVDEMSILKILEKFRLKTQVVTLFKSFLKKLQDFVEFFVKLIYSCISQKFREIIFFFFYKSWN